MLKVAALQHPPEAGLTDGHFWHEDEPILTPQSFHSLPIWHPVSTELQDLQSSEGPQLWHLLALSQHITTTCQSALR